MSDWVNFSGRVVQHCDLSDSCVEYEVTYNSCRGQLMIKIQNHDEITVKKLAWMYDAFLENQEELRQKKMEVKNLNELIKEYLREKKEHIVEKDIQD